MLRYIGRRLLQTIPVFFGATFLIFAMVYLMPGDPVAALGGDRGLTEAAAAKIRAEYHLDQPFWMQYLLYLKGVFTLDFGKSFNQQPVIDVMARAFPVTMALAIYALAIESIFGITLGTIAGVRRGGWFDSTILVFSLLLISVPTFVLGFVLQFLLGIKLGILPVTASVSVDFASLTMPAMVLGGVSLAYVIRLTRQSVSENVSADYVRTARAKGPDQTAPSCRATSCATPSSPSPPSSAATSVPSWVAPSSPRASSTSTASAARSGRPSDWARPPPSCPSRPCSSSSTSWPTLSLTSSTPCSTRGSAMSDIIPSANIARTRAGQDHYVSDIDETGLGAVDAVPDEGAPSSMWGEAWKRLRVRPLFWFAAIIIFVAIMISLFPSLFTSQDPRYCELSRSLGGPELWSHPFGFDKQGCDIYSRVIYGARASVSVGVLTTIAVVIIGGTIGAIAGYIGGWIDSLLSRITDVFFAIPLLLAAIVFMQMFKESRSIAMVVVVLSTFAWTSIARITRGSVMSAKNEEFVTAARATGASRGRILMSHIIPNSMAPIIVYATVALGTFIVSEASLSFMGIGLPTTVVSWGADISTAKDQLSDAPMVLFYPATALALTVLSFIMMGDAVREALDPKARK